MTRTTLFIILILFLSTPVFSMIKAMPFPDLVKSAEAVIIAKVEAQETLITPDVSKPSTKTSISVEKVLKGDVKLAENLEFTTPGSKSRPILDKPVFPAKGERVLLFLVKKEDGSWRLNNGVQGLWPLENGSDKTLGMGFNYSIKQVEEELAKATQK